VTSGRPDVRRRRRCHRPAGVAAASPAAGCPRNRPRRSPPRAAFAVHPGSVGQQEPQAGVVAVVHRVYSDSSSVRVGAPGQQQLGDRGLFAMPARRRAPTGSAGAHGDTVVGVRVRTGVQPAAARPPPCRPPGPDDVVPTDGTRTAAAASPVTVRRGRRRGLINSADAGGIAQHGGGADVDLGSRRSPANNRAACSFRPSDAGSQERDDRCGRSRCGRRPRPQGAASSRPVLRAITSWAADNVIGQCDASQGVRIAGSGGIAQRFGLTPRWSRIRVVGQRTEHGVSLSWPGVRDLGRGGSRHHWSNQRWTGVLPADPQRPPARCRA